MTQPSNRISNFWHELKRRKVVRVIIMYAGVAFIITELVNNISEPLYLPDWIATFVILILIIGFPIIAILSWIFDVTPEGLKKTEPAEVVKEKETRAKLVKRKRKVSDVIIAVLVVVVLILVYPKFFKKDRLASLRDEEGRISIAVMPFQNLSVDTLFNVWQEGVQSLLINKLSNSEELSVRQSQTMLDLLESTERTNYASITPSVASEIALKLETNTFILGSIMKDGNRIRISAQLRNAKTEEIYKSYEVDGDVKDGIFDIADSLSNLLKDYLEIQVLKKDALYDYTSWAFTSSAEAYRYYLRGMDYFTADDYELAIEMLNKAIVIDTNFFAAYDWLLEAYSENSQSDRAKQILNTMMNWDIDELSHIEQLSLKMTVALRIDKNIQEYIKICKQILEYDPQQRMFWLKLGMAYHSINQYEEAIKAFEKVEEIGNQWGVRNKRVWIYRRCGEAYHYTGNHDKEKQLYELGLSNLPDHPVIIWRQAICALSQGDTAQANAYITKFLSIRKDKELWSEAQINHRLAHIYGYANIYDRAEEYFRKSIQLEPYSTHHMGCLLYYILIKNDKNVEKVMELANTVLEIDPNNVRGLLAKGWGLYKQGHLEEAFEILNEAWDKRFSYDHSHYLLLQEVKHALASQNQ